MTIKKKLANTKETFKGTMKLALCLDAVHFVCYPTVALWLQKPSKNKIICKTNRKIVLEIVTVEEEN